MRARASALALALAGTGLGAFAAELRIEWTDPADNRESGFVIERRVGFFGTYGEAARVQADATEYVDRGLEPVTTYCYRIRALGPEGDSPYSGQACAQTLGADGEPGD